MYIVLEKVQHLYLLLIMPVSLFSHGDAQYVIRQEAGPKQVFTKHFDKEVSRCSWQASISGKWKGPEGDRSLSKSLW